jgi:hypothetical protein
MPNLSPLQSAQLCRLTYAAEAPLVSDLSRILGENIEAVTPVRHGDLLAVVVETTSRAIVIIRGTQFADRDSALRNAKVHLTDFFCFGQRCQVHSGYNDANWRLWPGVIDALPKAVMGKSVHVCGHSAGGAIACLFAVSLVSAKSQDVSIPSLKQLTTFGSPRVGDAVFASVLELLDGWGIDAKRFTTTSDPVPCLPLMARGYAHGLAEHYIDRTGAITRNPWWLLKAWHGLLWRRNSGDLTKFIEAHRIANYCDLLEGQT